MEDFSNTIIAILEKYGISYWEEGKNCSKGAINVECPICEDVSNHCGIYRNSNQFSCWKCGRKGDLAYLLSQILNKSKEALREEIQFSGLTFEKDSEQQIIDILSDNIIEISESQNSTIKLPEYFEPVQKTKCEILPEYINRRNLSLDILAVQGCGVCQAGKYMNRLIIPVVFEGELVGFQAADMTGRSETKYKADTMDSLIKQYFHGWDLLDLSLGYVVVVEGILDAWRLLTNVLCSFGTSLSSNQKKLLIKLNPRKLIFVPDGDAYFDTLVQSQEFTPFIEEVHVVQLPNHWVDFEIKVNEDPDSLGTEEVWKLIKEECFI